jgi:hypothetical protein
MKPLFSSILLFTTIPLFISCTNPSPTNSLKREFPQGQWSWEKKILGNKQKITVREIWKVDAKKGKYSVSLTHFRLGRSASDFPCSGSPSYSTHAKYNFPILKVTSGFITLGKPTIKSVPSPCDEELPDRTNLQLKRLVGGRIAVIKAKNSHFIHPWTTRGVWSWKRVTPPKNRVDRKVEIEEWSLKQSKDGVISGFYDRIVIRSSAGERKYSCNGKKEIWFFSRYEVKGKIFENGRIKLSETGYLLPKNENCEPSRKRHLDSFTGILIGDTIHIKSKEEQIEQTLKRQYGFKSEKNRSNK